MRQDKTQADSGPGLVMVLGASHSGTTMLDLMLGNNDATFSTGEVWAAFHPWRKHHFNPACGCGAQPCPVWEKLLKLPEDQFHYAAATQAGINHVVDSSKDLTWIIDAAEHARQTGMRMHNVVIWKEPIELAYSYYKREWTMEQFRSQYLKYYERFLDTRLPFVAVRFSSLVADPAETVRKLCKLTGLPWQPGQGRVLGTNSIITCSVLTKRASKAVPANPELPVQLSTRKSFLTVFDKFCEAMTSDVRLMRVIGSLDAMDIDKVYVQRMAALETTGRAHKPGWYFTHKLKRIYHRYFPETYKPTAADLN